MNIVFLDFIFILLKCYRQVYCVTRPRVSYTYTHTITIHILLYDDDNDDTHQQTQQQSDYSLVNSESPI